MVVTFGSVTDRVELEVVTDGLVDDWLVNLYHFRAGNRDSPATWCSVYSYPEELAVTGVLYVNTNDTSELSAFHGRLEGVSSSGVEFVMEF